MTQCLPFEIKVRPRVVMNVCSFFFLFSALVLRSCGMIATPGLASVEITYTCFQGTLLSEILD